MAAASVPPASTPDTPPPAPAPPPGLRPGPRPGVVLVRWVGALVVLVLLAGVAASLVVQFFAQERTETTAISQPVTRLVVRNGTGDVRVRAAEAGTPVQVTRVMRWSFREPTARTTVTDGELLVDAGCDGWFWGDCETDVDVLLRPGTTVQVTTNTGDIRVTASAAVEARTDTGSVDLSVTGSPIVNARTDTGDVTVTGGAAGAAVHAESDTGRIRLDLTAAPSTVVATTNTGDVTVSVPEGDAYRIEADTDTGKVRVTVPREPTSPRHIDARTDTGDVTVRAR